MIEPRTLKGFRDHLPAQALAREKILDIARRVYRSYGFAPIDTPALVVGPNAKPRKEPGKERGERCPAARHAMEKEERGLGGVARRPSR